MIIQEATTINIAKQLAILKAIASLKFIISKECLGKCDNCPIAVICRCIMELRDTLGETEE